MIPNEVTRSKVLVLKPEGRLDSNNVGAAETEVFALLGQGYRHVVVDLSGLDYISSAGLRLILVAAKRLSMSSGKLALCAMKPNIREVFEISGFVSILTVVGSRQEAEAAVSG
jgi:stage II sporulation protein AA (anti-sigma F factor antagonist)